MDNIALIVDGPRVKMAGCLFICRGVVRLVREPTTPWLALE